MLIVNQTFRGYWSFLYSKYIVGYQRITFKEEIRTRIAPAVSPRTIGNRLLAAGLRPHVPLAKLPLIPRHRQARLFWCCESVDWRVERRSVVFSDERKFCLSASDGRTCIWRRPGKLHLLECIRPRYRPHLSFHVEAGGSVKTRGHIWCFCRVK